MTDIKRCESYVKNRFGKKVRCNTVLSRSGSCVNSKVHLGKYKSGACGIGCHEGSNPKNINGHALPTCKAWQICSCKCHDTFDQMYQIAEQERLLVDSSSYMPDRGSFVMPDPQELALARASSNRGVAELPVIIKGELPGVIPATIARPYAPTPTGRAAKGELEAQVKEACDIWLVEYPTPPQRQARPCTPSYVSEEIGHKYGIKNPSVGAIDAVWKRWIKIGFAVIQSKPTRFDRYTEDGVRLTLEGCKNRFKRSQVR